MDKYEFNIKVEQIKKLMNRKDYATAMKIADTIDWRRVRNVKLLTMIAQVYEYNEDYQEAKDILLLAYERAPIGKRLLYKLTELAIKEGRLSEAEAYFREFRELAPNDPRQYLLRYMISEAKGLDAANLIPFLEAYKEYDFDERWSYELAELYHKAGREDDCVRLCDEIILWFSLGSDVERAMELKKQYRPLTEQQLELLENKSKYEKKLKRIEEEFAQNGGMPDEEDEHNSYVMDDSDMDETAAGQDALDEEMVVSMTEADTEKRLAEEMGRLVQKEEEAVEEPSGPPTKVLPDIKRALAEQAAGEETASAEEAGKVLPFPGKSSAVKDIPPIRPVIAEVKVEIEEEPEEETPEVFEEPQRLEEPVNQAEEEPEEDWDEPEAEEYNHFMVQACDREQGMQLALDTLKKIHRELGTKSQVAKITGSKLNARGLAASMPKLYGRDLLIEDAGDLSEEILEEMDQILYEDNSGMLVVLVDTPDMILKLHREHPLLAGKFQCIGWEEEKPVAPKVEPAVSRYQMQPEPEEDYEELKKTQDSEVRSGYTDELKLDDFIQYACEYARDLDCIVEELGILALYAKAEDYQAEGGILSEEMAEIMIDSAIEKAEHRSIGKLITGVFSAKYNKEGLLLLKEAHFKD